MCSGRGIGDAYGKLPFWRGIATHVASQFAVTGLGRWRSFDD